jgi:hypothetical protein
MLMVQVLDYAMLMVLYIVLNAITVGINLCSNPFIKSDKEKCALF